MDAIVVQAGDHEGVGVVVDDVPDWLGAEAVLSGAIANDLATKVCEGVLQDVESLALAIVLIEQVTGTV
tara:strand:- start:799 stop:1005 length:207 start_codon:yes stop_codon:yes gene_type:complete